MTRFARPITRASQDQKDMIEKLALELATSMNHDTSELRSKGLCDAYQGRITRFNINGTWTWGAVIQNGNNSETHVAYKNQFGATELRFESRLKPAGHGTFTFTE